MPQFRLRFKPSCSAAAVAKPNLREETDASFSLVNYFVFEVQKNNLKAIVTKEGIFRLKPT